MNIYLLIGATGEFSERNTWIVQAFTDEQAAIAEAMRLNELARVLIHDYWRRYSDRYTELDQSGLNSIDRNKQLEREFSAKPPGADGLANDYTIVEVPVDEPNCDVGLP